MMFLVWNYWYVFVLFSAISENINWNIIFKINWTHYAQWTHCVHCTHCAHCTHWTYYTHCGPCRRCSHCALEAEDTHRFSMRCQNFSNQRNVLVDDLNSINSDILKMSENEIVQVLFGNKSFSKDTNFRIITSSIYFIKDSKRFDESLSSWEKPFR